MAGAASLTRRSLAAALVPMLLASCVATQPQAEPVRPVPPAPVTAVPPTVAAPAPTRPLPDIDTPSAPGAVERGNWTYRRDGAVSVAQFGATPGDVAVSFTCRSGAVEVRILRLNPSAPATNATLRASTTVRTAPAWGGGAFGVVRLGPTDPILDALAFSRGRFALGIDGRERWFPAWPEVTRVIEDCRG